MKSAFWRVPPDPVRPLWMRRATFFGVPHDDFLIALRDLRDEVEERAYLAIVAAAEAMVQVDFRARINGRAAVPLRDKARALRRMDRQGRRIVLEDVLDAWADVPGARQNPISEFKQLLHHRHWLAHDGYWFDVVYMSADPDFALARCRALLDELGRIDPDFPRATA
ncbi:MAG: hypothetical protein ACREJ3_19040 [Polyangiaceae bacterium]